MIRQFENNKIRHLLRIVIALGIALIINLCIAAQSGWLIIATLFVMLTPTGSALYQGLLRFFLLVAIGIFYSIFVKLQGISEIPINSLGVGALIGIVVNVLILPDRVDIEFRQTCIPVLKAYSTFFATIIELLVNGKFEKSEEAKAQVEKSLLMLPLWIYDAGFDIRMQKGYRYFFMKINHIGDILFTLHYLAQYSYSNNLLDKTAAIFIDCVTKVDKFILALIRVLELKKITEGVEDFEEELILIEKNFKEKIPLTLEFLDVQKEYVYFVELVVGLKDFRQALIKLAKALR